MGPSVFPPVEVATVLPCAFGWLFPAAAAPAFAFPASFATAAADLPAFSADGVAALLPCAFAFALLFVEGSGELSSIHGS